MSEKTQWLQCNACGFRLAEGEVTSASVFQCCQNPNVHVHSRILTHEEFQEALKDPVIAALYEQRKRDLDEFYRRHNIFQGNGFKIELKEKP